ncbi:MAG: ABC transporter permease [Sulfolobales archaeon]|nr:ABC transporter permease [Sulfolobales archaeon]MCX8199214.1 ABC transporter permease [Sulfolobales archaeon]MDW8170194.1 ABC transporter permease [Desulfurococcaceae archaeon]
MLKGFDSLISMAEMELRRLKHDPFEIVARSIQPILWIAVFGSVMAKARAFPSVDDYVTFITPGVILQSSTFIALAYGIALIFERESGILKRLLASPLPRSYIVVGRAIAGGIRASTQYVIVLTLAALVGAKVVSNPINIIIGYMILVLACMGFTGISMLIASLLKTRERFMGIIGAITMPLFFASNALYPIDMMPNVIKYASLINPLTYTISILRKLIISSSYDIVQELLVLTTFVATALLASIKCLKKIIE